MVAALSRRAQQRIKRILVNIVAWMLPMLLFSYDEVLKGNYTWQALLTFILLFMLTFSPVVYFNNLYLIPKLLERQQKRKWWYVISLCAALLLYFPIAHYLLHLIASIKLDNQQTGKGPTWNESFTVYAITVVLAVLIKFASDWFLQQRKINQLQKQQMQSELHLLRGQLNPHFLFNTLNNLYAMTLESSPKAPEVVLRLSDIMRYMIYDCNGESVLLHKELRYLQDYIELQKVRLLDRVRIRFEQEIPQENYFIAPMLLVMFVENAFKHGIHEDTQSAFILIKAYLVESTFVFNMENSVCERDDKAVGGVGLKNVQQRLNLLYPKRHLLHINQKNGIYSVNLTIQLHEPELPNSRR